MSKAKKIKMGRPPLPKGQVKDVQMVIRLTPVFHKALCAAAKRADRCVTHYVRDVLAERLNQEP